MIEFTPATIHCMRGYYTDASGGVRHVAKPSKALAALAPGESFERIVEILAAQWHVCRRALIEREAHP